MNLPNGVNFWTKNKTYVTRKLRLQGSTDPGCWTTVYGICPPDIVMNVSKPVSLLTVAVARPDADVGSLAYEI